MNTFITYRIGRAHGTGLEQRNSGSALTVADHVSNRQDWEKPSAPMGGVITMYEVEYDGEFSHYRPLNGKSTMDGEQFEGIGRYQYKNGDKLYSFGSAGFKYRAVASVTLEEVEAHLKATTGYEAIFWAGATLGAKAMEEVFAAKRAA